MSTGGTRSCLLHPDVEPMWQLCGMVCLTMWIPTFSTPSSKVSTARPLSIPQLLPGLFSLFIFFSDLYYFVRRRYRRGLHLVEIVDRFRRGICSIVLKSHALGFRPSNLGESGGDWGDSKVLLDLGVAPSSSSPALGFRPSNLGVHHYHMKLPSEPTGVWKYIKVNTKAITVDELTAAEFLRMKEELVDGPSNGNFVLELDFESFNASFPKPTLSKSIGNGVEFLNRHMSAKMFHDKESMRPLLEFLKEHHYKGKVESEKSCHQSGLNILKNQSLKRFISNSLFASHAKGRIRRRPDT